jgi:ATP-dependent HslUV protease subunit HslV
MVAVRMADLLKRFQLRLDFAPAFSDMRFHIGRLIMTNQDAASSAWHGTTILTVRKGGRVVIAGDGQVSFGQTVLKANAKKVRTLGKGHVISGFAGATADAFTLFERLEAKLDMYPEQLVRACVDLAKDWRTDRYLRRLEAMMIVADKASTLVLTGNGDVLEPERGVIGIGSGGNFALAAARALLDTDMDAETIARKSMAVAAEICVYTNDQLIVESLSSVN